MMVAMVVMLVIRPDNGGGWVGEDICQKISWQPLLLVALPAMAAASYGV